MAKSKVKTPEQLKKVWGLKRYTEAHAFLSEWYIEWDGPPKDQTEMEILERQSPDAFEFFASRMYYKIAS